MNHHANGSDGGVGGREGPPLSRRMREDPDRRQQGGGTGGRAARPAGDEADHPDVGELASVRPRPAHGRRSSPLGPGGGGVRQTSNHRPRRAPQFGPPPRCTQGGSRVTPYITPRARFVAKVLKTAAGTSGNLAAEVSSSARHSERCRPEVGTIKGAEHAGDARVEPAHTARREATTTRWNDRAPTPRPQRYATPHGARQACGKPAENQAREALQRTRPTTSQPTEDALPELIPLRARKFAALPPDARTRARGKSTQRNATRVRDSKAQQRRAARARRHWLTPPTCTATSTLNAWHRFTIGPVRMHHNL